MIAVPARFQFHKGTIKTRVFATLMHAVDLFQFHKGTIKTCTLTSSKLTETHFNSIKVQLKHKCHKRGIYLLKFQFHKGTIKTETREGESILTPTFQFHKGTIKTG